MSTSPSTSRRRHPVAGVLAAAGVVLGLLFLARRPDALTPTREARWPSVRLGFQLVLPSYEWMLSRFEAARSGIQGLITLATTVTVATPLLARTLSEDIDFASPLFVIAMAVYLGNVCVSLRGLSRSGLLLIHPRLVYDKWLSKSEWEFMKTALYFAGDDFDFNRRIVERVANARLVSALLLAIELALVTCWMVLVA